jgi:hypothetical protein
MQHLAEIKECSSSRKRKAALPRHYALQTLRYLCVCLGVIFIHAHTQEQLHTHAERESARAQTQTHLVQERVRAQELSHIRVPTQLSKLQRGTRTHL